MFFHVLVGHLYVFFGKMTIWIICSFLKIGLWVFIHFLTSELYVVVQLLGRVWLFSDPTDCSPLGSSIWGILEWVAISFSSGSSRPRDQAYVSHVSWISRWILYHWATREELYELFIYSESSTPYQIYILPTLPLIQQVPFSFVDGFPSLYSSFFFFMQSLSFIFPCLFWCQIQRNHQDYVKEVIIYVFFEELHGFRSYIHIFNTFWVNFLCILHKRSCSY